MRADGVVVRPPRLKNLPGMAQGGEQGLVEAFVPQPAIEALHEGVLLRLSQRDILPFHADGLAPLKNCRRGRLGAVVGHAAHWTTALGNDGVQLLHRSGSLGSSAG